MGRSWPRLWQAVADLDGQERTYDLTHRCDTPEEATEALEYTLGETGRFAAAWREQGRRVRVLDLARLPGYIDRSGGA